MIVCASVGDILLGTENHSTPQTTNNHNNNHQQSSSPLSSHLLVHRHQHNHQLIIIFVVAAAAAAGLVVVTGDQSTGVAVRASIIKFFQCLTLQREDWIGGEWRLIRIAFNSTPNENICQRVYKNYHT